MKGNTKLWLCQGPALPAMSVLSLFNVWRRAEIAFGLVLYHVPCQSRALALAIYCD